MSQPRIPSAGMTGEQLREAAAAEFSAVTELVVAALRRHYGLSASDFGIWPHSMYPDRVIVRRDGALIEFPYTIADDNTVTLGAATEVVLEPRPVDAPAAPLREAVAGDSWFVEAKKADGDKPPRYLVRAIKSGLSKNGVNYPAKVLREAAALFNGARVFVKSDAEHIKGGGKDVRQLVGRLVEAVFVGNDVAGEIQAVLDVLETSPVAAQLRESVERGMTDLYGLSIDATGTSKPNGTFREATKLQKVASVDLIVEPGAGGQIIRFVEAQQEPNTMLRAQMLAAIAAVLPSKADALKDASDDDVLAGFREAVQNSTTTTAGIAAATGISQEQLDATLRLVEARADAKVHVMNSRLPMAAKTRLVQRFAEATDPAQLTADAITAAITAEEDYGKNFRESAPISGLGNDLRIESGETRAQAVERMLEDFFTGKAGGIRSFREAYVEITGDTGVTGQWDRVDKGRLAEAAGTFREAVSATTFTSILGNSITRQMQAAYRTNDLYNDWRDLVDIVPVRDFRTQERAQFGGYGNLPGVAENAPYTALTTPGEFKSTYAITKRGGLETVSLESIANDDVGLIRRIPTSLATASARTLYEFVMSFLATNPVIYDGLALFVAGHNNLGTAALDNVSFAAARLRMQKQAELSSAKPLGVVLRHVYVPADLEETAFNMFVRGTNNDETFVQSRKPKVHVVPHWTDTNNWYATGDKSQIPLIEMGFFNGQEEPELFVQDNPSVGSLFTNDQVVYKVRHIYSGTVLDYRGFDGSIVA